MVRYYKMRWGIEVEFRGLKQAIGNRKLRCRTGDRALTELDWAMKNGQICIWAPSKIVLDAVDGPSAAPSDAVALAAWFASTFEADEMLVIGSDLPKGSGVSLRAVPVEQAAL